MHQPRQKKLEEKWSCGYRIHHLPCLRLGEIFCIQSLSWQYWPSYKSDRAAGKTMCADTVCGSRQGSRDLSPGGKRGFAVANVSVPAPCGGQWSKHAGPINALYLYELPELDLGRQQVCIMYPKVVSRSGSVASVMTDQQLGSYAR